MQFFAALSLVRALCRVEHIIALILMTIPFCDCAKEKLRVELIAVGGRSTVNYAQLTYLGPPMSVAVDYINKVYNESLNVTLKYLFDDMPWANMLSNEYTGRLATQWYYRERNPNILSVFLIPAGIITPDLTYTFQQLDVLFLTVTSLTSKINDRIANPTWISTARVNYPAMTMLFCEVLLKYKWSTFMIILDLASGDIYRPYADQLAKDSVYRMGRTPLLRKISVTTSYDILPLLADIQAHTRIVIFLGSGQAVRSFLIAANKENMTNGDYVYMAFEIMDSNKMYGRMHWEYYDDNDKIARQAFQSLLIMRPADIYEAPKKDLAEAFIVHGQRDFNNTYDLKDLPYLQMLGSYSAVTILGEVMNDLWKDGYEEPCFNGTYIANRFLNRTFDNNLTEIYIDEKGGRQLDLYLWRFTDDGRQDKFLYKRAARNAPVIQLYQIRQWASGTWPPPNEPFCGYNNDRPVCVEQEKRSSTAALAIPIVLTLSFIIIVTAVCLIRRTNQKILATWWRIDQSQLEFERTQPLFATSVHSHSERKSFATEARSQYHLREKCFSAKLSGVDVIIEMVEKTTEGKALDRIASHPSFLAHMERLRNLNHQNISRLSGISCINAKTNTGIGIITERPARGCIYDVFEGLVNLDLPLISSLVNDFLEGVQFIHSSALGYHGCLCGLHCHVDKHFTLKISGLANVGLQNAVHDTGGEVSCFTAHIPVCAKRHRLSLELLQKDDVYAVGVVLWELLAKQRFSSMESLEQINAAEPEGVQQYQDVLALCWQKDKCGRPSVKQLRESLARKSTAFSLRHSRRKFIDKIQTRLASYTRELENEVSIRTRHLVDEMNRCNEIIAQVLPRWVANQIRSGNLVPAEFFECATLMFAQICGFGNLVKDNPPKAIIEVISESEIIVDHLIDTFFDEIYKVEVVDDCYLVASGLRVGNGGQHARMIAEFAIQIQQSTPRLFAQHGLQFKTGMHSGPCAAGIVGFRRLRYCLFGDTVNTASRMCSSGEPNRTQMSDYTAKMVVDTGLFETEFRGVISVKGKDEMTTYWLNGFSKSAMESVLSQPNTGC